MSISAVVFTALSGLGVRVYRNAFPQEEVAPPGTTEAALPAPRWPAIRYTLTNGTNEADLCGTDGVQTDDTDVQIDVVAKTSGATEILRDQVIAALLATDPPCTRENIFELWDSDTRTHRAILLYRFYASSPGGVSP